MQSPQAQTVVITCPNCGTRYQVPPDALGASGRKVSCAECGTAWLATPAPPPEPEMPAEDEDRLDAAFAAEQAALLAEAAEQEADATHEEVAEAEGRPVISPAVRAQKKAEGRFRRRQRTMENHLPAARLRRLVRIGAFAALAGMLAGLYAFRVEVVRMAPDLAGLYAAFGLSVNIVGLDFANVTTEMARRDGVDVLAVTGTIYPVTTREVGVPPILVEIRDRSGNQLYQWSVTLPQRTVSPGETLRLATELASPPAGATSVRLSFATGRGGLAAPAGADEISSHSSEETAGH